MAKVQLDAHQKPPEGLKALYKKYQRLPAKALDEDDTIIDFSRAMCETYGDRLRVVRTVQFPMLLAQSSGLVDYISPNSHSVDVFEHVSFPGLELLPALLPREVQWKLLDRLLHRDLANQEHRTNIHAHYHVPYELSTPRTKAGPGPYAEERAKENEASFFNCDPNSSDMFNPSSPEIHKPITIGQFLRRKLRWLTLGGQYDWTRKEYPQVQPPKFPEDIGDLIHGMFPNMRPEAAIVNVYSPGDTLALHRDVSETSDEGLVSISLGCDGLFIVGLKGEQPDEEPHCLVIRLRSGDGVYMSGATRYAFHGLPQIIASTCPDWLDAWPAALEMPEMEGGSRFGSGRYEAWRGWLASKRINLNVRQMNI
ncbi:hypothetical protein MMC30_005722 [Trapelia coarctata]|nr:hypothetical protein [Trapelia coarctata]